MALLTAHITYMSKAHVVNLQRMCSVSWHYLLTHLFKVIDTGSVPEDVKRCSNSKCLTFSTCEFV